MLDTVAVDDLALLLELLAAGAIQSLVLRHVEVVRVEPLDPSKQLRYGARVSGLGGPNPVVVGALEPSPELLEPTCHAVDPFLRRNARASCSLEHRLAVLIH